MHSRFETHTTLMSANHIFTEDYKDLPYWWEEAPRPHIESAELPSSIDVAIIGSGYTGLNAAIQTARAGRSTLVLDAEDAGWGCSSRNGGQISTSFKPTFEELSKKYDAEKAYKILWEGHEALQWIGDFIKQENIDCNFSRCGRFYAAHNGKQYDALARRYAHQPKGLEVDSHMVSRNEQHSEIDSDLYHGGIVFSKHASLQPAKYHLGLLTRAEQAGRANYPQYKSGKYTARRQRIYLAHTARKCARTRCCCCHQRLHRCANTVASTPNYSYRQLRNCY